MGDKMTSDGVITKFVRELAVRKEAEAADADRHRKRQIKNANQHYDFELQRIDAKFEEDFDEHRHRQMTYSAAAQKRDHSQMTSNAYGVTHHSETANLVRFSATHDISSLRLKTASIRDDIFEAAQDFESVTAQYSKSAPMILSVTADSTYLRIAGEMFACGDMVKCFSNLSQADFSGMISHISELSVSIICGNSVRITFLVSQIKDGRVVISSDEECLENIKIQEKFREASSLSNGSSLPNTYTKNDD